MHTHANQSQDQKSQAKAEGTAQNQSGGEAGLQFVDKRPEAVAQRKLQEMASESPQVAQLRALQAMANEHAAQQQQPIQKKENNTGLPDNLKSGIENLSGYAMDDVKVHRNSDKPAQLNAHAYAQGTDIHLGPGQEKHLAHEAWHVVQQKQGRVKPTMQMKGKVNINDDAGLEKEADVMGARALGEGNVQFVPVAKQSKLSGFGIVQRTLSAAERKDLEKLIGKPKTKILISEQAEDIFKTFEEERLKDMKSWNNERFTAIVKQVKAQHGSSGGGDSPIGDGIDSGGKVMEAGGALIETATEGTLATIDAGLEGVGGGIAGVLDTTKGAQEAMKEGALKKVEGGSLALSGLLGLADIAKDWAPEAMNFIPGIGNYLSLMSGGAKMLSGISQGVNIGATTSSLNALKGDASNHNYIVEAAEKLLSKLSYFESMKTTGLAALETGGGALMGGAYKYGTTAVSKLAEPVMNLANWSYTKLSDGPTKDEQEEEQVATATEKAVMNLAVANSGTTDEGRKLLGRLYKLTKGIAPDLAEEMVKASANLAPGDKTALEAEFK